MSGTSLDGLDLCLCRFELATNNQWNFKVICTETIAYSTMWTEKLSLAHKISGAELIQLHADYGSFIGNAAAQFLAKNGEDAELVCSHGHTVFHQPDLAYTFQLGNGANLAASSGIPCVCDFRTTDVAKGGQGAPLVPFGDMHLFSDYDACLNLGGFANISLIEKNPRSFDICPVNIVFNHISALEGMSYDKGGQIARSGNVNSTLLSQFNKLDYYQIDGPKSLGREWVENEIIPKLKNSKLSPADQMRTFLQHVLDQISRQLDSHPSINQILVSGGGSKNDFLMEELFKISDKFIVPEEEIIDFKEAIIFGFLGLMRLRNEINCLSSVTGATTNSISGCIYLP